MSSEQKKFYITTPIYYVNARPHIGHTYTTVVCDAIARRRRMLGFDTFFLTGTDEHGQKIERSAAARGMTPKQLADEVSAGFRALWDRMGIRYDGFMRTTDARHEAGVQEMFRRLRDKGFIYKGSYSGQYCVFDELYVGEGAAPGTPCPECGRPYTWNLIAEYRRDPQAEIEALGTVNVALVKYWGKRDDALNLPYTGSISITLAGLSTTARVRFGITRSQDRIVMSGEEVDGLDAERIRRFLDLVRLQVCLAKPSPPGTRLTRLPLAWLVVTGKC